VKYTSAYRVVLSVIQHLYEELGVEQKRMISTITIWDSRGQDRNQSFLCRGQVRDEITPLPPISGGSNVKSDEMKLTPNLQKGGKDNRTTLDISHRLET
jgi:hypothetical protein